ncbi:MAG: purine-nucleoside phosphorylase [Chloroflexi bacterium]|nr:purine-nucleoside phosphorylase [Chloroflexota bacterium]
MQLSLTRIINAGDYIRSRIEIQPLIGMILGSGLGDLAEEVMEAVRIPFSEIPNFPPSTVEGHAGEMVIGRLDGKPVLVMKGRIHFYEGYSLKQVTFPVRIMQNLGIKTLVVTNAAGGVNPDFKPGDLMLIKDHINLQGSNPLIGANEKSLGVRFPDMTDAYDPGYRSLVRKIAAEDNVPLQEGVYGAVTGPSYETPAEVRYMRTLGVDAIGMSTVPEVITARHAGIKVMGISCITNAILKKEGTTPVTHEEVLEVSKRTKPVFIKLVSDFVRELPM